MSKFWKTSLALAILATCFVMVADAANQPRLGYQRWQSLAGWGSVDTLTWNNQDSAAVRKDSIGGTINDTTVSEVDITGVQELAVWIVSSTWRRAGTATMGCGKWMFQVSPDRNTWLNLSTAYSQTSAAAKDTQLIILYDEGAAKDTVLSATAVGSSVTVTGVDMRKVKASKYLRIIYDPDAAAGDTVLFSTILVREWPPDIK